MIYDVIIIGGGPAGYTSALYSARAGFKTLIAEKLSPGGQMSTTASVENYPGFDNINGFELAMKMKQSAEKSGAVSVAADVISVELDGKIKKICTKDTVYESKTAILASGAAPRELGLKGESELRGRGVSYCAACDGMFYRGKTVVVVGGGNSAVTDALFLSNICEKVILVHRRDHLTCSKIYREALKKTQNVEIVWNSQVTAFNADEKIKSVTIENTISGGHSDKECDGVFIAIGRVPNTDIFKGKVDMDEYGYIIADETTVTSVPGVYAAGDVRTKPFRQIITAAADGAVATKFIEEYLINN